MLKESRKRVALGCTGIRTRFADRNLWIRLQCSKHVQHGQAVSIVSQSNKTTKQNGISELSQVRRHLFQKVAKRTLPSKSELLDGAVLKASKGWRVWRDAAECHTTGKFSQNPLHSSNLTGAQISLTEQPFQSCSRNWRSSVLNCTKHLTYSFCKT